jgi:hypothetical protein
VARKLATSRPRGSLDGDRNRGLGTVTVPDQEFHQCVESGAVIADPKLGHLGAVLVDEGYVVVFFRPVDTAEDRAQPLYLPANLWVRSRAEYAAL